MDLQFEFTFKEPAGLDETLKKTRDSVRQFFRRLTPDQRLKWKANYEEKILIESGKYEPGVYGPAHKLSGKRRPYPPTMPWMKPAWESGLKLLNEVIDEQNNLSAKDGITGPVRHPADGGQ